MIKYRNLILIFLFVLPAFLFGAFSCKSSKAERNSDYRLAVVLVIDQMRPDYFTRFGHLYSGGLARIQKNGAVLLNGYHDHSMTATAVGHATISTGLLPSHHGVVGNYWYDRVEGRRIYSSGDSLSPVIEHPKADGQSPKRLLRAALGDWLKRESPSSKVVSIALKDRAATFMGGLHPDAAFWIDFETGDLVTSTYYMKKLPGFVDSLNNSDFVKQFNGAKWERLLDDSAYQNNETEAAIAAHDAREKTFPHSIGDPNVELNEKYYEELFTSPFGDYISIEFAKRAVLEYQLGKDDSPDILWLGCLSADYVGHSFGPNSDEVQDYYLRLDKYLDGFFKYLDSICGAENYFVTVSSDHGVMPLPEYLRSQGIESHRLNLDTLKTRVLNVGMQVAEKYGSKQNILRFEGIDLMIEYKKLPPNSPDYAEVEQKLAEEIRKLPDVADVYTRSELTTGNSDRPYFSLYKNNFHPTRGGDLQIRLNENVLLINSSAGTTHLTPYKYDTLVPIAFLGQGIKPGNFSDSVRTVDMAPTAFEL
ncbi:MAG TPA: alkaline phosphatase family protein, partial [candidate division Zixibacteria bacterium]|nr:alkaline phosphatase family protein [candidate division Zixibacteria bacterium]